MKAIIIASGRFEPTAHMETRLRNADLIIAADGGAAHLMDIKINPHVIIGDLDSIPISVQSHFKSIKIPFVTYPAKKDKTDTEICIDHALEKGATDITLMGVTGSRLDHTLTNILLLEALAKKKIPARIMDQNNTIHITCDHLEIQGQPGDFISLVPLSKQVEGVCIEGMEYPLENATLIRGSSLGVSNKLMGNLGKIRLCSGSLLLSQSRD